MTRNTLQSEQVLPFGGDFINLIFSCDCKHNRSNTSHICLGGKWSIILLTINNNYVINLCINVSEKQR